jgi:hypothetical protein
VICAVKIGSLNQWDLFMLGVEGMETIVGFVERIPQAKGYVTVTYLQGDGKHRNFKSNDTDVEFTESGFRRSEWSAGTLVRPLNSEGDMGESNPLVDDGGPTAADIKAKVEKLKQKAASKAAAPAAKPAKAAKGAPAAKAPKAPREKKERVMSPCRCGCGTETGGTFAPGHDARFYGWLKKVSAGTMEFKELPKHLQKEFVDVKGAKKALAASGH